MPAARLSGGRRQAIAVARTISGDADIILLASRSRRWVPRVNLIQDGVISFEKPTAETSVEELTDILVEEYRRARLEPWTEGRISA